MALHAGPRKYLRRKRAKGALSDVDVDDEAAVATGPQKPVVIQNHHPVKFLPTTPKEPTRPTPTLTIRNRPIRLRNLPLQQHLRVKAANLAKNFAVGVGVVADVAIVVIEDQTAARHRASRPPLPPATTISMTTSQPASRPLELAMSTAAPLKILVPTTTSKSSITVTCQPGKKPFPICCIRIRWKSIPISSRRGLSGEHKHRSKVVPDRGITGGSSGRRFDPTCPRLTASVTLCLFPRLA